MKQGLMLAGLLSFVERTFHDKSLITIVSIHYCYLDDLFHVYWKRDVGICSKAPTLLSSPNTHTGLLDKIKYPR